MPLYMVYHTYKTSPAAYAAAFSQEAVMQFATANASGAWPARLIKTWDPIQYGRADAVYCLWEARRPEDIAAVLHEIGIDVHLNSDIMQVDETEWNQLTLATT